jgi:acetylornithine deacetylase/succinyl-diaminopimelate desuccinylase-like protein
MSEPPASGNDHGVAPAPEQEVVEICRELIRIDTSNYGDGSGPGERKAAEYVAGLLGEAGLDPVLLESNPGRASVVARMSGADPDRPPLLVHGHLDVVPARAEDWTRDPFAAEEADGCLWGRGAVDMKDMDAMILACVRDMARSGRRPPRDVVLAFTADEEAGGRLGAHWLVDHHPDLFDGVEEAISEVGGFCVTVADRRIYLLQTAEKGILWLRLVARGRAGHGSQVNDDNAVTRLAAAVSRIGSHDWPREVTPTVRAFLDGMSELSGTRLDAEDQAGLERVLGTTARWVGATVRNTANPTALEAGYKHNVIPGIASALIDCRFLPGREEELLATVRDLAGPGVDVEVLVRDVALEAPADGDVVATMHAALRAEDPGAHVLPYCLAGGTDNKAYSRLGVRGYGFVPLRLPEGLDFAGMFHGVDERVPLDALRFGTRVLGRLLDTC